MKIKKSRSCFAGSWGQGLTPCLAVHKCLEILKVNILINDERLISDINRLFARWI
jgi:hypothetical protein